MRTSWSPKDCSLWKHKAGKAALLQDQPEVPNGFSVAAKRAPWVPGAGLRFRQGSGSSQIRNGQMLTKGSLRPNTYCKWFPEK